VSSRSGSHIGPTSAITQLPEAGPWVGTQIDSFMPTGLSWPGYRGLTGSAPTTSQLSGLKQSNNSLWATDSLRPTAQAIPSHSLKRHRQEKYGRKTLACSSSLTVSLEYSYR